MLNQLDIIDIRILQLMQNDARLTNKEIGEKLHKSASTINDRIRKMQSAGYIKKYVVLLEPHMVDRGQMAFTHVQLKDHSKKSLSEFENQIIKFPEVLECYHMSGEYDFILRVAVKDLNVYHDFLMNKLFEIMSVGSVQSTFVMKQAKSETAFPLEG